MQLVNVTAITLNQTALDRPELSITEWRVKDAFPVARCPRANPRGIAINKFSISPVDLVSKIHYYSCSHNTKGAEMSYSYEFPRAELTVDCVVLGLDKRLTKQEFKNRD